MTKFRLRVFSSVLVVLLTLAVVAQPAIAQLGPQPARAPESLDKKAHQPIPAGKDCSSCHTKVYAEWKAGPHGKNEVQCTVCHGTVPEKMTASVSLSKCGECHSEHALRPRS